MTPEEEEQLKKSRKGRNVALALALVALAILFYAITIARIGGS